MRTIWLVIKHDVAVTLRQRSFWILTLLMPVLLLGVNIYSILQGSAASAPDSNAGSGPAVTTSSDLPKIGLVDEAGLIVKMPPDVTPDPFIHFADNPAAQNALQKGQILQYVDIPPDYLATGQITVYAKNFQIAENGQNMGVAGGNNSAWVLQYIIDYNLTGNEQISIAIHDPTPSNLAQFHDISPASEAPPQGSGLAEIVSTVVPYMFYFLLLMASSYLMRSVVAEKENRTAETLLLSLNPRELMLGKILAMSAVVLIQIIIWMGGGILLLRRGAQVLQVAQYSFPPGFILWAMLFLVLGYLLFASIMAAAGALATSAREGGQMTWLLIIPLMPTLMFSNLFLEEPNSPLILALSMFPFSAPSAMVTRLAVTPVPLWQILVSLGGLAVTTFLVISLAGRFFRASNLLSSESFSWQRLATGWRK